MRRQALSLQQFQRTFVTEQACVDYLFKQRWPRGYVCPRCNHSKYSFHSVRRLYQCSNCKYQTSVTAGTVFHKTKTPLSVWFWMIFLMTRQKSGVSMMSLQRMLGIRNYRTVWTMGHKIRKAMSDRESRRRLAGLVDIETSSLRSMVSDNGRKENDNDRSVVASVEKRKRGLGFARLKQDRKETGDSSEAANPSSWYPSEESAQLQKRPSEKSDSHQVRDDADLRCRDSAPSTSPKGAAILISNLRGIIKGVHHGVSEKHLHRYLGEFSYRFNRRWWEAELFSRALLACLGAATITFAELTQ